VGFDKKEDRLKTAWIWIGFLVFTFGVILFTTYGVMLGPISHEHAAWSSFGSLLGGFFMIASTGATIATLLFLAHQNKQLQKVNQYQQAVTQAQLAAMNFEQYINHRRLFMDRLVELQSTFENKFVFVDGEKLYNNIFPKNGPTNLEFKVELDGSDVGENLLGRLGSRLEKLDKFLDQSQWKDEETRRLVGMLIEVYGDLQIRWTGEAFDGDIMFFRKHTGINIYSLNEFLTVAKSIYNSLLFYTGNSQFTGLDKSLMRYSRDALMEYFLNNHKNRETLEVLKIIPGLEVMERLYFNMDSLRGVNHDWLMKRSYSTLLEVFRSRNDVMKLRDDLFVNQLVSNGCRECSLAMETIGEENEDYELLKRCHEDFNTLLALH